MIPPLCFLMVFLSCKCVSATTPASVCTDPVRPGSGGEKQLKFYYDSQSGSCAPFFYSGEGGNSNRFDSDRDCLHACSATYNQLYPSDDAVCSLPVDRGSCYATIPQFYYDSGERMCRVFLYGGCGGNGNRFSSRDECQRTCSAKSGRLLSAGDAPNPDLKTVDAGLVVGVLGGLVFAAAVIAAVVMFVLHKKSKKTDRKPVPTSDIELN